MIERENVTGLILCGGSGARLEGRDKPLEDLAGMPLVAHVRERLLPQVGRITISCNRNVDAYRHWGDEIVADGISDQGPLAGILAAMNAGATDYLFVCPGDAPFLSATLVERLMSELWRTDSDTALPHDGVRRQHLFLLIRRSLAAPLRDYLDCGGRSVHAFVDQQRSAVIDASFEKETFFNVNSTSDLAAAAALLRQPSSPHRIA